MAGPATYDTQLHARARATSPPTLHEAAGRRGELPAAIKPLAPDVRLCGPAFPVQCAPGDNLWIHHALYAAAPGEVLVVHTGAPVDCAYFGDIMTIAAQLRGIAGLVVQGGVRDVQRILELSFPVFCTASCIRGPSRDATAPGSLGTPVRFGDVTVARGDLVVGDADGVIVLPAADAERIVADAGERELREKTLVERLRAGETTLGIFGVPMPGELRKP
jgi:4-hydroxy-4-methyl-2-oxoglutarate aldolase